MTSGRPICLNCETRAVACTFTLSARPRIVADQTLPSPSEDSDLGSNLCSATKGSTGQGTATSSAFPISFNDVENVLDLSESRSRRILEL